MNGYIRIKVFALVTSYQMCLPGFENEHLQGLAYQHAHEAIDVSPRDAAVLVTVHSRVVKSQTGGCVLVEVGPA